MIEQQMVARLRGATCAVGYLQGTPHAYASARDVFAVLGTGFLVRETTVMTNRHVLQRLHEIQSQKGFDNSRRCLSFVRPGKGSGGDLKEALLTAKSHGFVENPELDIGFIEIARPSGEEFQDWIPLKITESICISTGMPVGLMGYPYGRDLLNVRDTSGQRRLERWGPVLNQGYVSSVAPLDGVSIVDGFTLDVRCAKGMSGSPIFKADDGIVVGLFHMGTTDGVLDHEIGYGIPIFADQVDAFLKIHDQGIQRLG